MKTAETSHPAREGPRLIVYTDGASRGNPGRSGAGVWITDEEGRKIAETGRYLGHRTNNEAEYQALLLGLRESKRFRARTIRILMDSELIVRQVKGLYRVRDLNLRTLYKKVMDDLKEFSSFEIEFIPREQNAEADRLANQAIQRGIEKEKREESRRGTDGRSCHRSIQRGGAGEESPSSTGQGGP